MEFCQRLMVPIDFDPTSAIQAANKAVRAMLLDYESPTVTVTHS